jgi:acyl-CoA synthetase (AMP-forming)/AMP-acid ligase II
MRAVPHPNDELECEPVKPGQILLHGPNIMSGYVGIPSKESDGASTGGYFETGDIGYVNEKGYIFLVGRSKELIKVKG